MYGCKCINYNSYVCLLQSPCYKHVKKIDCPVTIIDLYSDPTDDEHDCTVINSYGESYFIQLHACVKVKFERS